MTFLNRKAVMRDTHWSQLNNTLEIKLIHALIFDTDDMWMCSTSSRVASPVKNPFIVLNYLKTTFLSSNIGKTVFSIFLSHSAQNRHAKVNWSQILPPSQWAVVSCCPGEWTIRDIPPAMKCHILYFCRMIRLWQLCAVSQCHAITGAIEHTLIIEYIITTFEWYQNTDIFFWYNQAFVILSYSVCSCILSLMLSKTWYLI